MTQLWTGYSNALPIGSGGDNWPALSGTYQMSPVIGQLAIVPTIVAKPGEANTNCPNVVHHRIDRRLSNSKVRSGLYWVGLGGWENDVSEPNSQMLAKDVDRWSGWRVHFPSDPSLWRGPGVALDGRVNNIYVMLMQHWYSNPPSPVTTLRLRMNGSDYTTAEPDWENVVGSGNNGGNGAGNTTTARFCSLELKMVHYKSTGVPGDNTKSVIQNIAYGPNDAVLTGDPNVLDDTRNFLNFGGQHVDIIIHQHWAVSPSNVWDGRGRWRLWLRSPIDTSPIDIVDHLRVDSDTLLTPAVPGPGDVGGWGAAGGSNVPRGPFLASPYLYCGTNAQDRAVYWPDSNGLGDLSDPVDEYNIWTSDYGVSDSATDAGFNEVAPQSPGAGPNIVSLDPTFGPVSSLFDIAGSGFTNTLTVAVDGISADASETDDTSIEGVLVPLAASSGNVAVQVTTDVGGSNNATFQVQAAPGDAIKYFDPASLGGNGDSPDQAYNDLQTAFDSVALTAPGETARITCLYTGSSPATYVVPTGIQLSRAHLGTLVIECVQGFQNARNMGDVWDTDFLHFEAAPDEVDLFHDASTADGLVIFRGLQCINPITTAVSRIVRTETSANALHAFRFEDCRLAADQVINVRAEHEVEFVNTVALSGDGGVTRPTLLQTSNNGSGAATKLTVINCTVDGDLYGGLDPQGQDSWTVVNSAFKDIHVTGSLPTLVQSNNATNVSGFAGSIAFSDSDFVDAANENYALAPGSALVIAGVSQGDNALVPDADIRTLVRLVAQGEAVSIGAFEGIVAQGSGASLFYHG